MEEAAKVNKKGIWAGTFQQPDQWRKEHPRNGGKSSSSSPIGPPPAVATVAHGTLPQAATVPPVVAAVTGLPLPSSSDCLIKGNISSKGEKLYHLPGGKYYEATKIDKAAERWFCNEKEAVAAGWRAAKG